MNCQMKDCSLKGRLLRLLLIPLAIGLGVIGAASYLGAYHETEEVYDAQLVHFARVLHRLTLHEIEEGDVSSKQIDTQSSDAVHAYEKHFAYRVLLGNEVILNSINSQDFGPSTQSEGFTERMIGDTHWRFFVLKEGEVTIEVAEENEVRLDLIRHVLAGIFLPQLLLIPLIGTVIWLGVARGVQPLKALSALIDERNPNSLQPIAAPIVPREVVPVIDAINDLMRRMAEGLEKEKHFSNYAAHELRTPLAALKTQIQVALRSRDAQQQQVLFGEALQSIDRMSHLVEQLLTFVRVQRSDAVLGPVDLSKLCQDVLLEMEAEATRTNRHIDAQIATDIQVVGNAELLQALVRNLLGNALKYTHDGGHILFRLQQEKERIKLSVADDGIGIDPEAKPKLFDSFFRAASGHAEGSGLGLAIAKWVADTHQAQIEVSEGLNHKGCCFMVAFTPKEGPRA